MGSKVWMRLGVRGGGKREGEREERPSTNSSCGRGGGQTSSGSSPSASKCPATSASWIFCGKREKFKNGSRSLDETRSQNSPKKLATPEGNSQLGSNCPNYRGPRKLIASSGASPNASKCDAASDSFIFCGQDRDFFSQLCRGWWIS